MTTDWIAKNRTTLIVTVVVLVAAYVFYYAKNDIAPSMYTSAWGYAIPLVLAALVGVIGERSGVVNIGIEGQMLVAAFAGFFAAAYSGSLVVGVLAGIGSGLILGGFLAWTTVKWRMDQIIAGVVLNIIATGITSFYYQPGKLLPGLMPNFDIPLLSKIPLFGPVFFTGTSVFAVLAILAAPVRALRPVPHPVGPAHPLGRRVPLGRRHRRHQRRAAAAGQRHARGLARRLRRRLPVDGRVGVVRARHGRPGAASSPWPS